MGSTFFYTDSTFPDVKTYDVRINETGNFDLGVRLRKSNSYSGDYTTKFQSIQVNEIPEPITLSPLLIGSAALLRKRRQRQN